MREIPLALGSFYHTGGELHESIQADYLSRLDEHCEARIKNDCGTLGLIERALITSINSRSKNPVFSERAINICAKRLLNLKEVSSSEVIDAKKCSQSIASSVHALSKLANINTTPAGAVFLATSGAIVGLAKQVEQESHQQIHGNHARERRILFQAVSIIRESMGFFPSNTEITYLISLILEDAKSKQWIDKHVTSTVKEQIEEKIKQSRDIADKATAHFSNLPTKPVQTQESRVVSPIEAIDAMQDTVNRIEHRESRDFLQYKLDEMKDEYKATFD